MFRRPWRAFLLVGACALGPGVAAAGSSPSSSHPLLELRTGSLALDLGGGSAKDDPGVGGNAALSLDLPQLPIRAEAGASTGQTPDGGGMWHKQDTKLTAGWSGLAPLKTSMSFEEQASSDTARPSGVAGTAQTVTSSGSRLNLETSSPTIGGVSLTLGANAARTSTTDSSDSEPTAAPTHIETGETSAFARASWQILPQLAAKLEWKEQNFRIGWAGVSSGVRDYRYGSPDVEIEAAVWRGADLSVSAARDVGAYDEGTYAALATAPAGDGVMPLEPDHAWRYGASLDQKFGAADLHVADTRSTAGTVTELAGDIGAALPVSTAFFAREEANVGGRLPLSVVGLPRDMLSVGATVRSSRVRDPITRRMRRASGETGGEAHVALTHTLNRALKIGLKGGVKGQSTSYAPNEIANVDAGPLAGAFISYIPGPFELDLSADNLVGARRETDSFFDVTRAQGAPGPVQTRGVAGPTFSLSLKKPL